MTSVTSPKEVVAPKIVGSAIYLELIIDPKLADDQKCRASYYWNTTPAPTKQVIIFPAWTDDSGKAHRSRIISREVSGVTPRAQWEFLNPLTPTSELSSDSENSYYAERYYEYKEISKDDQKIMAEADLAKATQRHAEIQLQRLVNESEWVVNTEGEQVLSGYRAWIIRENKPVAVEVTDEDMKLVAGRSTPQAVIRRINKVRGALDNFPEKLG